jgi:hypothetical protein
MTPSLTAKLIYIAARFRVKGFDPDSDYPSDPTNNVSQSLLQSSATVLLSSRVDIVKISLYLFLLLG